MDSNAPLHPEDIANDLQCILKLKLYEGQYNRKALEFPLAI